ncbi:MAG: hypothetical protein Q7S66_01405 [bacterium]|nr:hypothetical protein [bacterium]
MFEDEQANAKSTPPPSNLYTEPADMFAEVDADDVSIGAQTPNAIQAGFLKPKVAAVSQSVASGDITMTTTTKFSAPPTPAVISDAQLTSAPTMYTVKEPVLGKLFLVVIIGAIIVGVAYGAYWMYTKFIQTTPTPVSQEQDITPPVDTTADPSTVPVVPATQPSPTSSTEVNQQQKNDQILFGEPIDSDSDGLDDVREKQLGTDPNNSDTDKDGLSDGDEVLIWRTNPLIPDSDGDGYLDGNEVSHGYDPLGPGKMNLSTSAATSTTTK